MITSSENKKIKQLALWNTKSKARHKDGVFVAEGLKMFQEAPRERVCQIYEADSFYGKKENQKILGEQDVEILSDSVFRQASDTMTPQGVITVVRQQKYSLEDMFPENRKPLLLVLDSLQDPGNLGTMIRTGEGAGITGVIMNQTTVDLYNPKTIRSTMGSVYRIPTLVTEELALVLEEIKNRGVAVYAAHLKGSADYDTFDYSRGTAFLIGNEGNGLSDQVADCADSYLKIPMCGQVESLNAAMAAGILLYEAARQRRSNVSIMGQNLQRK